jgi:hypothetical protein
MRLYNADVLKTLVLIKFYCCTHLRELILGKSQKGSAKYFLVLNQVDPLRFILMAL